MKIAIEKEITSNSNIDSDSDIWAVFKEYSIFYRKEGESVVILQQKILLPELNANDLMFEMTMLFDFTIAFDPLGGYGCDFAITVQ